MNDTTSTLIPHERLTIYRDTAATMGDVEGMVTTIRQVCGDQVILEREGRTTALRGAKRLLADVTRRLCATAALSEESAKTKVGTLASAKRFHRDGRDGLLMVAMIDAAIAVETEKWLASSTQH